MGEPVTFEKMQRTVKSQELLRIYNEYKALVSLCIAAKTRALSDKNNTYVKSLGLEILGTKKLKRENTINNYFDTLQKTIEDSVKLNLVAEFEKLIFHKIPTTIDSSKDILSTNYEREDPFASSIKSFVKSNGNISALKDIKEILSGSISVTLSSRLTEIIDYRNRVSHGKRFGKESQRSVPDTMLILDEVLEIAAI